MNIFENFIELSREENFFELKLMFDELVDKKYVYKNFFDESMFYKKININKLKPQEIEKINNFIKRRLLSYPNFYPHLARVHDYKYNNINIKANQKLEEEAKKSLEAKETLKAVDKMMSKNFTNNKTEEIPCLFSDDKSQDLYKKIVATLSKEIAVGNIIKELKEQIANNFTDYLLSDEIKVLASYIAYEVYFRTKKPSIYCNGFSKIENQYNEFQQIKKYALKEKVNKMLLDCDSEEDIEKIVEEISKDLKMEISPPKTKNKKQK